MEAVELRARVRDVLDATAAVTGIALSTIMGPSRVKEHARARHLACLAARREGHTYLSIGRVVGRDHSSVIHGCDRAQYLCERYPHVEEEVEIIRTVGRRIRQDGLIRFSLPEVPKVQKAKATEDLIEFRDQEAREAMIDGSRRFLAALRNAA